MQYPTNYSNLFSFHFLIFTSNVYLITFKKKCIISSELPGGLLHRRKTALFSYTRFVFSMHLLANSSFPTDSFPFTLSLFIVLVYTRLLGERASYKQILTNNKHTRNFLLYFPCCNFKACSVQYPG